MSRTVLLFARDEGGVLEAALRRAGVGRLVKVAVDDRAASWEDLLRELELADLLVVDFDGSLSVTAAFSIGYAVKAGKTTLGVRARGVPPEVVLDRSTYCVEDAVELRKVVEKMVAPKEGGSWGSGGH